MTYSVGLLMKNEANKVYDLEAYSGITNNRKPPQNFDTPETQLFAL